MPQSTTVPFFSESSTRISPFFGVSPFRNAADARSLIPVIPSRAAAFLASSRTGTIQAVSVTYSGTPSVTAGASLPTSDSKRTDSSLSLFSGKAILNAASLRSP